jgi:ABC-type multidrug transport system permease subunit
MNRWHAFSQLVLCRIREFYREPEALFWVYGFPLILAIVLGLAFRSQKVEPPAVDITPTEPPAIAETLAKTLTDHKLKVEVLPAEDCENRMRRGETDLFLSAVKGSDDRLSIKYHLDKTREKSVQARFWVDSILLRAESGTSGPQPFAFDEVDTHKVGSRYIDFLLPGLVGMNLMGGGMFGIGFVLVEMRVRKLFKRLIATPMNRGDFLLSMLASRLLFLIPEMFTLLVVARMLFGVPVLGSWFALVITVIVGSLAFAGIGLLIASRTEKTETVSALMNLIMMPSWIFSGVFFSSKRFPDAMQPFIQALPLTQLNDALREVMLEDGKGIETIWWRLAILVAYAAASFFLALRWFRWA